MSTSVQAIVLPKRTVQRENLEQFAIQIEEMFKKGADLGAMGLKRHICRLMTHQDPRIALVMTAKWVEWRYGNSKQRMEITGPDGGPIEHTIKFGDGVELVK